MKNASRTVFRARWTWSVLIIVNICTIVYLICKVTNVNLELERGKFRVRQQFPTRSSNIAINLRDKHSTKDPTTDRNKTEVNTKHNDLRKATNALKRTQRKILRERKKQVLPCLEFFHVPKTGGTTIEDIVLPYGIAWGFQRWMKVAQVYQSKRFTKLHRTFPDKFSYAIPDMNELVKTTTIWHIPLSLFSNQTIELVHNDCDIFIIVRNPYTRWVSTYNSKWQGYEGRDPHLPETLNKWVNRQLDQIEKSKYVHSHLAPEWMFAYDQVTGKKTEQVKHILHFEDVFSDRKPNPFNKLMEEYGILARLNPRQSHSQLPQDGIRQSFNPLTLTQETRDRIYKLQKRDFEYFGYERDWSPNSTFSNSSVGVQ